MVPAEFRGGSSSSPISHSALSIQVLLLTIFLTGSGLYSIHLGADRNWDLLNYHFYIPYAFLDNRLGFDLQPAQAQTYLNPLLDVPFFVLIRHFNDYPRLVGFLEGTANGVGLFCIAVLSWRLLGQVKSLPTPARLVLCITALIIGGTGADSRGLIGTTTGDIPVAVLILCALVFALLAVERSTCQERVLPSALTAGLFAGLAFGLKPTTGPFGLGLFALLLTLRRPWRFKGETCFLLLGGCGFLLAAGWNAVTMYRMFGNPAFPMFNAVFHSPYFEGQGNGVLRGTAIGSMLMESISQPLSFVLSVFEIPFLSLTRNAPAGGLTFRDVRLAIAIALAVIILALWIENRWRRGARGPRLELLGLSLFLLVGTYSSLVVFSNYRYMGAVEYVSGALIVVAVAELLGWRVAAPVAVAAAIVCVLTTKPIEFPHASWGERYLSVDGPDLDPDTLVVIATDREAASFLIPFFDPRVRWIRTRSNLIPMNAKGRLMDRARSLIAEHQGPSLSLEISEAPIENRNSILSELLVERTQDSCMPISTAMTRLHYMLCPLRRVASQKTDQPEVLNQ